MSAERLSICQSARRRKVNRNGTWPWNITHWDYRGRRKSPGHFICFTTTAHIAGTCLDFMPKPNSTADWLSQQIQNGTRLTLTSGSLLKANEMLRARAWCFVEALKANPFNLQAAELLRQLLIDYPTLPLQSPWIQLELDLLERG